MAFIDDKTDKLIFKGVRSEKQKLFIQLYCHPESDTFDNGTQSYKKAYDGSNDNVAAVESHRLLTKDNVKDSIERYKAYLHELIGFELDWLDANLRNLFYRVRGSVINGQLELRVLRTIGDRIGAFEDQHESSQGITVPLTKDDEKLCNIVMNAIADKNRSKIKKIS
jgi:hypothetical protein